MRTLEDKVALVTGGGSGIGRATSLVFAGEGARVGIADIDDKGGLETCEMIRQAGGRAFFLRADVSQNEQAEDFVNQVVDTFGPPQCALNNVGISGDLVSVVECSEENWNRVIDVSLKSVWLCMKAEIDRMLTNGGGAIVNMSSTAGLLGFRKGAAYSACKHGVLGLTKSAALEYAKKGIRVNAVCPGVIDTPATEKAIGGDSRIESVYKALSPTGRMGTSEEVAKAVLWLCSDAASFVNGHALVVDGGYVIN
ncbi:glucose 1-dehydrogenase [Thermodesulfobacteriota bacterium]